VISPSVVRDVTEIPIVETTTTIANQIIEAHIAAHAAAHAALTHARRAGELLNEVKESLPHGAWQAWLAEHCPPIAERTCRAYMQVAKQWPQIEDEANRQRVASLPLRAALKLLAAPREDDRRTAAIVTPAEETPVPEPKNLGPRKSYKTSRRVENTTNRFLTRLAEDLSGLLVDNDLNLGEVDVDMAAGWGETLCAAAFRIQTLGMRLRKRGARDQR
jgi:hypothetical protein